MRPLKRLLRPLWYSPATWRPVAKVLALLPRVLRSHLSIVVARRMPKEVSRELLLEALPKGADGAEIGVWKGDYAARLLAVTSPTALHLIDPWVFQPQFPGRLYGGDMATSQQDMDAIHDDVCRRFAGHEVVQVHRRSSIELVDAVGADNLDWIYIDGDHSRDAVARDLELAWQALRPGGVIGGDDYAWPDADRSFPVRAAVDRFAAAHGVGINLIGDQFLLRKGGGTSA